MSYISLALHLESYAIHNTVILNDFDYNLEYRIYILSLSEVIFCVYFASCQNFSRVGSSAATVGLDHISFISYLFFYFPRLGAMHFFHSFHCSLPLFFCSLVLFAYWLFLFIWQNSFILHIMVHTFYSGTPYSLSHYPLALLPDCCLTSWSLLLLGSSFLLSVGPPSLLFYGQHGMHWFQPILPMAHQSISKFLNVWYYYLQSLILLYPAARMYNV